MLDYLADLVATIGAPAAVDRTTLDRARQSVVGLSERSVSGLGEWKWNREELYEDRLARFEGANLPESRPGFAEAALGEEARVKPRAAEGSPTLEEMTTVTGAPPAPGHDAWFRRQVQRALDDKKSGKAKYTDFHEIAAKLEFRI